MMILLPLAHLTALYGYGLIMVGNRLLNTNFPLCMRHRGRVVRAPDLKSCDPVFKSRSDHLLGFFQLVPVSTPRDCTCTSPTGVPPAS